MPDEARLALRRSITARLLATILSSAGTRLPRAASRIRASLDGAGQVRPIDTLWRLNEQGLVDKVHINAWKKLRNAVAHGDEIDGHEELQGTIDLYHQCLGLFYRLIFILVDYKGDFVDYSARNWPTRRMLSTTAAAS